jgi:hypothetical protein
MIEVQLPDRELENQAYTGIHHGTFTEGQWTAAGTIMGCGIMQLYGLWNAENPQAKVSLEKLKERLSKDASSPQWIKNSRSPIPCRTFIAMIGTYKLRPDQSRLKAIKDLGFIELTEYDNAAHQGTTDRQKLFILTW